MFDNNQIDGYVSANGLWAAVPCGKKYMIIHNGSQISVHNTLETAKKIIQKQIKNKK
jgi:hypothetical protein